MKPLEKYLATYCISAPILLKFYQLYLAEVPFKLWFFSFTWEWFWCLSVWGILYLQKNWIRLPLLMIFHLVAIVLLINVAGYAQFGLFLKSGHLELASAKDMFHAFGSFLTPQVMRRLLLIQLGCCLGHLSLFWVWRKYLPKDRIVILVSFVYFLVASLFSNIQFEEQVMSLVISVSSYLEKPYEVRLESSAELLNPSDADFGVKPPSPIADVPKFKQYNLIIYPMESVRAMSSSSYGCSAPTTPFLDDMRDKGIFFERCYSNAVRSIKALTTFTLGIYPYNSRSAWSPRPIHKYLGDKHLAGILNRYNYHTTFFVNSHISFDGRETFLKRLGFHEYRGTETFISSDDSVLVDQLDSFFEQAEALDKPLLSLLLPSSGHAPYPVSTKAITLEMATREAERVGAKDPRVLQRYLNAVHHQDQVGAKIYEYLVKKGRLENTIFVMLGDHGESFGEHGVLGGIGLHGSSLFEESVHVPAWIHHPDLEPQKIKDPVQFLDMLPTWLAMMGLEVNDKFPGRNVLHETREKLFLMNHAKRYVSGVLSQRYKLIAYEEPEHPNRFFQLFDLKTDPFERDPLGADHPAFGMLANALDRANNYFPAVQEHLKHAGNKKPMPEPTGLPAWSKLFKSEVTSFQHGGVLVPHIPKKNGVFELELVVNFKKPMPTALSISYYNRDGELIEKNKSLIWFQREACIPIKPNHDAAAYAMVSLKREAKIWFRIKSEYGQTDFQSIKHYGSRTTFSGRSANAQAGAMILINPFQEPQTIKMAIHKDGLIAQRLSKELRPGGKEMMQISLENSDEVKLEIEAEKGVATWWFRWEKDLADFR